MTPARPRLVVLRALGLGDFLTGLPALRALARAFPEHRRILAGPRVLAPLARLSGAVDEISPTPGLVPLEPRLSRPEVAVDLHGRGPGSQPLLLELRPDRLIAFEHPSIPATAGGPRWRPGEHEVVRWCRLLEESGVPADPGDLGLSLPELAPGRAWLRGATLIHPGAASAARRWPPDRFAAVAARERASGRVVAVTAGPGEAALAARVAAEAGLPEGAVVAGLGLDELVAVVGAAARVVCGDTGLAHLATATATPSVVLFGPVPPSEWGPPPGWSRHRALWAGRRGDPHGSSPDPGLLRIGVGAVLEALDGLEARAA